MNGKLNAILQKIYHDMAIVELKRAYAQKDHGTLSYHDVLYLSIIEAHPNEYTSSQIADMLGITRPSVTQKINELCKKGYIVRTRSEKDKRVYYLSISPSHADYCALEQAETLRIEQALTQKYGQQNMTLLYQLLEDFSHLSVEQQTKGVQHD